MIEQLTTMARLQASTIRHYHASRIFYAIRLSPGISQNEIACKTGSDKSTVSTVIKGFEIVGLVERSARSSEKRPGRPSEGLRISSKGWLLAGVSLHPDRIDYTIGGLDGAPMSNGTSEMPSTADHIGQLIRTTLIHLCTTLGRSLSTVRAVGVSVPGFVTTDGTVVGSPNLKWTNVPLRKILERSLGVPVYVDNDANGAALAEGLFGVGVGQEHFVYVESGSGVGGGLLLNGSIYRGFAGLGGEIGHTKIAHDGRPCHCGRAGCLSAYVADYALLDRAAERNIPAATVADLARLADCGNTGAIAIFEEAAGYLGTGLANIANTFNPSLIVLGGMLARYSKHFVDPAVASLRALALPAMLDRCRIEVSAFRGEAPLPGATAIALYGCTSVEATDVTPWQPDGDGLSGHSKP